MTIWAARCGYELNAYKDVKDIPSRSSWSRAMTEDGEEIVNCAYCKRLSQKKYCQIKGRRVSAKHERKTHKTGVGIKPTSSDDMNDETTLYEYCHIRPGPCGDEPSPDPNPTSMLTKDF